MTPHKIWNWNLLIWLSASWVRRVWKQSRKFYGSEGGKNLTILWRKQPFRTMSLKTSIKSSSPGAAENKKLFPNCRSVKIMRFKNFSQFFPPKNFPFFFQIFRRNVPLDAYNTIVATLTKKIFNSPEKFRFTQEKLIYLHKLFENTFPKFSSGHIENRIKISA